MIRKLIAGLALVGALAVGGASAVSAETSGPSGTTPSTQNAPKSVHDRRCAIGTRLAKFLDKVEARQADRLAKLEAKKSEITDPDKLAKLETVITNVEHRQTELKQRTDKLAAKLATSCPAAAPAAA